MYGETTLPEAALNRHGCAVTLPGNGQPRPPTIPVVPEWLSACLARDACAGAVAQVVVAVVLVGITAYYAIQTHALVVEQQRDRAATFLPLLFWQSPAAACANASEPDLIRRRLNVVLWNIGNGAGRVTHKAAQNSEGVAYQVAHFDTPSIVPATAQLTLRLFRDQLVEDIIRADDSNFLRQEDVTLTLHYEDVVEHRHYETHITVRCHFDEASGKMPEREAPPEPPVEMNGFIVSADWVVSDPRSARDRLVKGKCATCGTTSSRK